MQNLPELQERIDSLLYWFEELNDQINAEPWAKSKELGEVWSTLNLIEVRARHTKHFIEDNFKID